MRPNKKPVLGNASSLLVMLVLFIVLGGSMVSSPVLAEEQSTVAAEEQAPDAPQSATDKKSSGDYVMQLIMSLIVVIVAIAVLAWLMKRLNRLPKGVAGHMQVLGSMALGARERAVLVQVGETQMLLGVSPGRVSTLHVFPEPVVDADSVGGPATNFASILNSLGKNRGSQ